MQSHYSPESISYTFLVPLLLFALILIAYLAGVLVLKRANRSWNLWRTVSFVGGIVLVVVAMLPQMMQFAHHDLRGHMVQHLLVGMFAPLGLVLGAPVTLALKVLPGHAAKGVTAVLGSTFFHVISHPVVALLLNIGGMFVLYLTPLYNATLTTPALHYLVHFHFIAAGYLYTWAIAGPDPAPRRPGLRFRFIVLVIGTAAHAYLSKYMYAHLLPANSPHSTEQIQAAAQIMYYGGDVSELLLAIALFDLWYKKRNLPKYKENLLFN